MEQRLPSKSLFLKKVRSLYPELKRPREPPRALFIFNQPLFAPAMPNPFDMKFCDRIYSTIDGIE